MLLDDVVEVDRRGVCETALRTLLFGLVLKPLCAQAALTFSDALMRGFFVREIPAPRVLSLFCLTDLFVLERHLELLFPVEGSCKGIGDTWGVQTEPAGDEVIGAWSVIRGV